MRKAARVALIPFICAAAALYFTYFAMDGRYGYRNLRAVESRIAAAQSDIGALTAQRDILERNAALLSTNALDEDYLEERARKLLSYGRDGDIVLPRRVLARMPG